jgi:hypothetical protein
LEVFSHSQPVPRRELRIISTVRIIIDTMPTSIISIFLVNTIDTMRASMFMIRSTRTRFRRVLCSSRLMKDRPPLGMRTWTAGRGLGVAGICVNRLAAIRDLNTTSRDHGLITAPTPALHLSAPSWFGDITSERLSVEKTGNGLFKVEMMAMQSELGRALSPVQSLSEMRMPQCEYAGRSVGIRNAGSSAATQQQGLSERT